MGHKLSLMGVFENVFLPSFPSILLKFRGGHTGKGTHGTFETQVKILNPERREVVTSAGFDIYDRESGLRGQHTFVTNSGVRSFVRSSFFFLFQIMIDGKASPRKHLRSPRRSAGPAHPTDVGLNYGDFQWPGRKRL